MHDDKSMSLVVVHERIMGRNLKREMKEKHSTSAAPTTGELGSEESSRTRKPIMGS
jgi:hypothetical protein